MSTFSALKILRDGPELGHYQLHIASRKTGYVITRDVLAGLLEDLDILREMDFDPMRQAVQDAVTENGLAFEKVETGGGCDHLEMLVDRTNKEGHRVVINDGDCNAPERLDAPVSLYVFTNEECNEYSVQGGFETLTEALTWVRKHVCFLGWHLYASPYYHEDNDGEPTVIAGWGIWNDAPNVRDWEIEDGYASRAEAERGLERFRVDPEAERIYVTKNWEETPHTCSLCPGEDT